MQTRHSSCAFDTDAQLTPSFLFCTLNLGWPDPQLKILPDNSCPEKSWITLQRLYDRRGVVDYEKDIQDRSGAKQHRNRSRIIPLSDPPAWQAEQGM
jgi:hypothetical protein